MIMDDIADALNNEKKSRGIRELSHVSGINKNKLYSIINGCNFVINPEMIAALSALGYELVLRKKGSDDRGT